MTQCAAVLMQFAMAAVHLLTVLSYGLAVSLQVASWQSGCNAIEASTNPVYTRMGGMGPMKVIPSDITIGIWGIAALSGNIIARLTFLSGRSTCGVQQRPLTLLGTSVQGG
jgi:hypothetical protein